MEINKQAIETEFKVAAAKEFLKQQGVSQTDIDNMFHWSNENYVVGDYNGQKYLFDDVKFATDISTKYGIDYDLIIGLLDVSSDAKYVSVIKDLETNIRKRMYEDLSLGVKDVDAYLEQRFLEKDQIRDNLVYYRDGKYIQGYSNMTFEQFKQTNFYKMYVYNILGENYINNVMYKFFKGKSTANVYCVQNSGGLNYTKSGTFGRPEGANVFTEDQMLDIFNSATLSGEVITLSDLNDIFSGKKVNVQLDYSKIAESLDLPNDYFSNGGGIVRSSVGIDDVRATTFIDDAANSRFASGMHTAHTPELMAAQKNGLEYEHVNGSDVYIDNKNGVAYLELPKK